MGNESELTIEIHFYNAAHEMNTHEKCLRMKVIVTKGLGFNKSKSVEMEWIINKGYDVNTVSFTKL